ncbi:type II secretion system F family protein [Desulfosporosinus sp. Sb-LF]|uniref:type II secretion system F family protein n=1 Tax=Desulfosporosinus sp. Sb-LF TaxID=2560027 RepID=UPI00107F53E3|nr:type II secretion system F family protein [Desulfosporosinus sp. Sb-LF]TGE34190.1 type II secretion system F family protein [Desulfosporosinus sp. Sb-LF]
MRFRYKVIDEQFKLIEGTLEAHNYEAARRVVFDNHWQLISLSKVSNWTQRLNSVVQNKIKYAAIASLCSQLAMMIRSGTNIAKGLNIILQSSIEDKRLRPVIETVFNSVSEGSSLSEAMKETEGALPELLVNLISVGEESGNLDLVLTSMAEYYERENFIRKKIVSAAIYPIILVGVLIALVIFFLGFILPQLTDLITSNGQQLPVITQVVINLSDFIRTRGWLLVLSFGGMGVAFYRLIKIPRYRLFWHQFLLGIPILGRNMKDVVIARISRSLALFLHSAVPIVQILFSLEKIVDNEVTKQAMGRIRDKVIKGESIAGAFGQEPFFDALLIQMMLIGEETGRLEELMIEVANSYDKRVDLGISRLVSLVEPVFTLIIGGFAALIIVSIAVPIFNMSTTIK